MTITVAILLVVWIAVTAGWYLLCRKVWLECDRMNRETVDILGRAIDYLDLAKEQAENSYVGMKECVDDIRKLCDDSRWN